MEHHRVHFGGQGAIQTLKGIVMRLEGEHYKLYEDLSFMSIRWSCIKPNDTNFWFGSGT